MRHGYYFPWKTTVELPITQPGRMGVSGVSSLTRSQYLNSPFSNSLSKSEPLPPTPLSSHTGEYTFHKGHLGGVSDPNYIYSTAAEVQAHVTWECTQPSLRFSSQHSFRTSQNLGLSWAFNPRTPEALTGGSL